MYHTSPNLSDRLQKKRGQNTRAVSSGLTYVCTQRTRANSCMFIKQAPLRGWSAVREVDRERGGLTCVDRYQGSGQVFL